jgi:hypothetical protein
LYELDLLELDGEDLLLMPLSARKAKLAWLLARAPIGSIPTRTASWCPRRHLCCDACRARGPKDPFASVLFIAWGDAGQIEVTSFKRGDWEAHLSE